MTETTPAFKMILTDMWDQQTCEVVGQIIIAFAQLEQILWLGPKRSRKLPIAEWEGMAGNRRVPERCEQIRHEYAKRHLDQAKEAELDQLLRNVLSINEKRNSVVHGRWGCKKSDGKIVSRHRIWKRHDYGVGTLELERLRDQIRELRDKLNRFGW